MHNTEKVFSGNDALTGFVNRAALDVETDALRELPATDYIISDQDRAQCLGATELKPCPMCGRGPISCGEVKDNGNKVYQVLCPNKDCQLNVFYCSRDIDEARIKAIARWNQRYNESPKEAA